MEIVDIIFKEYYSILENKQNIKRLVLNETQIDEQFDFGYYTVDGYGSAIIKGVEKIKSPISGRINDSLSVSSCKNVIVIESRDEKYFLEYCNVPVKKVNNNQKVSEGDLIGTASAGENIKVTLYTKYKEKVRIDSDRANELVYAKEGKKDKKDSEMEKEKQSRYDSSPEPLISGLFQLPFKALKYPFKNKTNKKGEITQKRWASPGDKKQPDPWILQSLKDPFGVKRRKKEKEEENGLQSNVTEEINRIKQLIK